jgi:uncharacterized membrane protein
VADRQHPARRPQRGLNRGALVRAAVSTVLLILFVMLPDPLGHNRSADGWVLLALTVVAATAGQYIVAVRGDRRLDDEIAQWRRRLRRHTTPKTRPVSTQAPE